MKQILLLCSICLSILSYGQGISMGGGSATGKNSFSYGTNTTASGEASIAGGINSIANKIATIAIGENASAVADYSISIGQGTYAGGEGTVSMGAYNFNQGVHSVAFGLNNIISDGSYYSSILGAGNFVDGWGAIAVGRDNQALGASSVAMGTWNKAYSYGEVVLGSYADTTGYTGYNPWGWQAQDRLFVLGNGVGDGAGNGIRSNALVILKSGDASFQGGITIGSLETAIDANEDTKLVVYGGTVLSETADLEEQVLIGTSTRNNSAKLYLENRGYPYAFEVNGRGSSSGTAVKIEGNTLFDGDVTITGSIAKGSGTFKIDHPLDPENKYLYHSFVESPDMMNIYNGNILTDKNGNALVELPEYFDALNMDFRYQLTPIGEFAQAIIAEKIEGNHFKIKTDKPNVEVSWQVTGVRNDPYAQQNRVKVSVEKPDHEKGTYMHPKAYASDSTHLKL
ncbi:hypothetical protein [Jiulongibacter sp. NS-SX5]|uniref:hypothetical protein n=1 Tax=Jiulongibacter sp. NS-SX5 TaxID=3463854 RepID=UPI00405865B2